MGFNFDITFGETKRIALYLSIADNASPSTIREERDVGWEEFLAAPVGQAWCVFGVIGVTMCAVTATVVHRDDKAITVAICQTRIDPAADPPFTMDTTIIRLSIDNLCDAHVVARTRAAGGHQAKMPGEQDTAKGQDQ
jgi:hypothetical protein